LRAASFFAGIATTFSSAMLFCVQFPVVSRQEAAQGTDSTDAPGDALSFQTLATKRQTPAGTLAPGLLAGPSVTGCIGFPFPLPEMFSSVCHGRLSSLSSFHEFEGKLQFPTPSLMEHPFEASANTNV
jgi:hypothetical protein